MVLDPGHGGLNTGAIGVNGLKERDVVLDVSNRLRARLQASSNVRVVMTRHDDGFVGLRDRTREANRQGASLFLSIHANANPKPIARGVEVYLLSARAAGDEGLDIVAREEQADLAHDHHDHASSTGHTGVLRAVRLAGAQRLSSKVARLVHDELVQATGAPARGVRQAPFGVLKEAEMPAVVVEIGYLTNPEEAQQLGDPAYRDKVAAGIESAVVKWLHTPPEHRDRRTAAVGR